MRVEQARYTGEDNKGQKFLIVADRAVQQSSNVPVVTIEGMRARLDLARGPLSIAALKGRYDLEQASWSRSTGRSGWSAPTATGWRRAT